ncbi:tRNA pseudouridine38-40 synthase [Chishuiella changwenlii]|uniref:tRNA pseudouridine synthase A n=1 Tax=Chishuiella changwenlii TaxID=1434701 RepID=A0A1M7B862_9FLAO|nr:tRNA pseudouridine(38-40) synthase TruA [Chishuiella changwenlii]GGE96101.1 tRNA pseudouridine synthase A [Chishuiella changwenlii]SHL51114.1 tRNA pseudouridine38-40 synthase [Chishuiella changwenlii]
MRYFLELAYNGKNYFGYQIQPNQISVQEVIEDRLSKILRKQISIVAAGRTDTGVHAKRMFVHFDYEEELTAEIIKKLNSFLPKDIAVYHLFLMDEEAHARFDATSRSYNYYISPFKDPFSYESAWIFNRELNVDKMNEAAKLLIKQGDFGSFAKLHTDVKTNICDVREAFWRKNENNQLVFQITADRFLRNMVRAIVGTLVEVGLGKISIQEFNDIIEQKNRSSAGASAPAHGLYLVDVQYSKELFKNELK